MRREIHKWWSPNLYKDMEIAVYGHWGFAVLMFPTAGADFLEYERFQMIDSLAGLIDGGKCKIYSINSINNESWLNEHVPPRDRGIRHQQYNEYIVQEVLPFIHNDCQGSVPVVTSGASLGALHAANTFFRRPDLFAGVIAMSGVYNLEAYSGGYFDDNVYFNSPVHYLPNWEDEFMLNQMRSKGEHIIIATGQGEYEDPGASIHLSDILHRKGIPHSLELWGHDMPHDWHTWRQMLPYFLGNRF